MQSRLLFQRQALHIQVNAIRFQRFQGHVGCDVLQPKVLGVKLPRGLGGIPAIVAHAGMAHNQRIDA